MSLTTIRTEIKAVLEGITDIGMVHGYERFSTDWKKFLDFFKPAGKDYIRGWTIRRVTTTEELATHEEGDRDYSFKIRGYMSLSDSIASSDTFDDYIETICDTFRALIRDDLNDKADMLGLMQVDLIEDRMFGTVLCHYCELSITIQEGKTV